MGVEEHYTQYGPPSGEPLLAFHGVPDSRHIWSMMAGAADESGVRLLAFDRPGFGARPRLRPADPGQSARDAAALADFLGIDHFSVIGISGGAMHALATAHALGRRVDRASTVSGWCLLSPEGRADMQRQLRLFVHLVERHPRLAWLAAAVPAGLARVLPSLMAKAMVSSRPAGDRAALEQPQFATALAHVREQFASPGAIVEEIAMQASSWPFLLEEVTQPATVWQGGLDDVHPPAMGRHLATRLPAARLVELSDRCTFDLFPEFRRILHDATR